MKLFGVVNASPDSLHDDSIVSDGASALARGRWLLDNGADALDIGGQGSTDIAEVVSDDDEWRRLVDIVPVLATLGVELSIDTWKPEVARRALDAGATILNAADGLQRPGMVTLAADYQCPVVLPYLNGPDPRNLARVEGDPVDALIEWFDAALARLEPFGIRKNLILDPGTGFAPSHWEWAERYLFQKRVYSNLHELRRYDLPLYVALPWRETAQHEELMEIVCTQRIDYGRCHHPDRVRAVEARVLGRSAM